jgi:DNA polymerase I
MVNDKGVFLIDFSPLIEDTHKAFLGAPLILDDGRDVAFLYGIIKNMLTLRRELRIGSGIILISQECFTDACEQKVIDAVNLIKEMSIPVINAKNSTSLDICHKYAPLATAIYSRNEAMLQFARQDLCIIRNNKNSGYEYLYSDTVLRKYGIMPNHIPTFLALTNGQKDSIITKNQAVRLIEIFGKLESIFAGLSLFPNTGLRSKISENESAISARYKNLLLSADRKDQIICNSQVFSLHLDTEKNAQCLHSLGLHSLTRLLGLPLKESNSIQVKSEPSSCEIIDNKDALIALTSRFLNVDVWAIDTESSSRDPRSATLFGIAFSDENGWSGYVPFLDHDLKGISAQDVVNVIKAALEDMSKKFIGHNIKYDYLLLRRNGIHLSSLYFDTMLAAFECYGDLDFFNLGFLAEKYLGKKNLSYKDILGKNDSPWDIPVAKLAAHSTADTETTFQLYIFLQQEISAKGLINHYFNLTMPLCKTLGELEYGGVRVDKDKLNQVRNILIDRADELTRIIRSSIGRNLDIDSDQEVKHYLLSDLGFSESKIFNRPFTFMLEGLGIIHDIPRQIVRYRRLMKDVHSVDVILKSIRDDKIYPIFSQIKSKSGIVTTKQPDLFDMSYLKEFPFCFELQIRPFFRDPLSAMNRIQAVSHDELFRQDMSDSSGVNAYLNGHPLMKGVDANSFLLAMITDMPDRKIANRFFIDMGNLVALRKEIESRYEILFRFLNKFKTDSLKKGFSEMDGNRKYWVGLKSPNLDKRRKAEQFALKWLIAQ